MDLIRDVLDNQLIDREGRKLGRADGIVAELRDDQPPRLTYIEIGMPTLARRLHPRLEGWVAALQSKWGARQRQSARVPWSTVRDVGINVEIDLDAESSPVLGYENWLKTHLIERIFGGR